MVWVCFSELRIGNCVSGIMDSQKYNGILKRNVMPSVNKLNHVDHRTFKQDNDPKHTSQSIKAQFRKRYQNVLEWPSEFRYKSKLNCLQWGLRKAVEANCLITDCT